MSTHRFPVDRMVGSKLPVRVVNAWSRETECLKTDFSTKLSEILLILIFLMEVIHLFVSVQALSGSQGPHCGPVH